MMGFLGTVALVFAAITGWWWLATTYFKFDVAPPPQQAQSAPEQHAVVPQITVDLKHLADVISAADHHVSIIIGFVVVVAIFAWVYVRITEIHARQYYVHPRRLEDRREEHRGNLPVVRR